MIRARRLLALSSALTFAATLWALSHNPLASPFVARSSDAVRTALTRALALKVTPDWLVTEIETALTDDDMDRLLIALDLARDHAIALPRPLLERALIQAEAAEAPLRRLTDCATCAWDAATCASIADVARCALPVELTPLGDINALRRAASAHLAGDEIDRLDTALALTGLAATGAVLLTAGASAPIKAGATALRVARRADTLPPTLSHQLRQMSDLNLNPAALPGYLAGTAPLDTVADTAKLARLTRVADDFGQIARQTSPAEAIALLRHADTTDELATLARLAKTQGKTTRATIHALGKARTFRALHRISDLALATLALLSALAGQIMALLLAILTRAIRP